MDEQHRPQWSYARQCEVCCCGRDLPCPVKRIIAELAEVVALVAAQRRLEMLPPARALFPLARAG